MTARQSQTQQPGWQNAALMWAAALAVPAVSLLAQQRSHKFDGLALGVGASILIIASIVSSFSLRYMRADLRRRDFFLTIGLLVGSVLSFISTGHLAILALSWSSSGWLLARLVGHASGLAEAAAASRRTFLSFAVGDAALVSALLLLGANAGSPRFDVAIAGARTMPTHLLTLTALLLLVAASVRCALPPFSGWLLSSMTAATPVSALMHAGLVNAGGFLLIRFAAVFEAAPMARIGAVAIGFIAALHGLGIMAIRPDIKRSLAGSTVSQMGFMIMCCGLGTYAAALWHIIAHGVFKAWLFLGSGSTIGIAQRQRRCGPTARAASAIASLTIVAAVALVVSGHADGGTVPLLLGIATAGATLSTTIGAHLPVRARAMLIAAVAALIGSNVLGLAATGSLLGANAPAVLPGWALAVLLASFLAAWVAQQWRLSAGRPVPAALYIHFLNAGALNARKG